MDRTTRQSLRSTKNNGLKVKPSDEGGNDQSTPHRTIVGDELALQELGRIAVHRCTVWHDECVGLQKLGHLI